MDSAHFVRGGRVRLWDTELSASAATIQAPLEIEAESGSASVTSWEGVDAGQVTLINVDMSQCRFADARHLDQIRMDGDCPFGTPPAGWRFSRREVIEEEREWRAAEDSRWGTAFVSLEEKRLVEIYRSLRKALEDQKNEPGAADFYYAEMDLRRLSSMRRSERWLLHMYWALPGYGLRASRALIAWAGVVAVTSGILVGLGMGAEPALRLVVGSVIFRDGDEDLSAAESWTVMAARLLGPVLLALAVLSVRSRIKR